ncbi:MAG: S41 family peptidase [Elusimicrobiales bacterium]|nr:S41 family peptidase [Elusimicrobiales bacterium]
MKLLVKIIRTAGLILFLILLLLAGGGFYLHRSGVMNLNGLNSKLAAELFMSEYNPFRVKNLTLKEAAQDTEELFASFERVHPDISANIGKAEYERLKIWTAEEVAKKAAGGKISVRDFAYILYRSAAALGDGHTRIYWQYRPDGKKGERLFPPFLVDCRGGKFLIDSVNQGLAGYEIIAVNGKDFRAFIKPILDRIPAETAAYKGRGFARMQAFWWDFSRLLDGAGELKLTLRGSDGKKTEKTVAPITLNQFTSLGRTSSSGANGPNSELRLFEKEKVAWLEYRNFIDSKEEEAALDKIFREIKAGGFRDLVIDIRRNGGGSTNIGNFIFSYLTDKEFQQVSKLVLKVSPEALDMNSYYKKYSDKMGQNVDLPRHPQKAEKKPEVFFDGKARLLIGNDTFSSATAFAVTFRDYKLGEILGNETGGVPVCFGEALPMKLRNSGIKYSVSDKQFFSPKPRPGDDRHGVLPDVEFTDELLRPYRGDTRRFVMDRIERDRKAKAGTL